MATIYIHAGTPKTGSTTIQDFLKLNEQELERHGILHPYIDVREIEPKAFRSLRNGDFLVFESFLPQGEREAQEKRIYQKGFDCIKKIAENAKSTDKILLTDEAIWIRQYRRESFWQNVLKDASEAGCDVKVIVYLRRQDLYAQALWNQSVKYMPHKPWTFSEYLQSRAYQDRRPDYYATLCEMAEVIGKENLIVRVFEKDLSIRSKAGIFEDFLNAMGEEMQPEYRLPERNKNERLDGNFIEIKRVMNKAPSYDIESLRMMYSHFFLKLNQMKKEKKVSYFSYEEQVEFLKQYEESNRRVAKEFLGREDGVLFTEEIEKLPKWEVNQDTMYEDIIMLFAEIAMAQQKRMDRLEWELHNPIVHFKKVSKKVKSKLKKRLK